MSDKYYVHCITCGEGLPSDWHFKSACLADHAARMHSMLEHHTTVLEIRTGRTVSSFTNGKPDTLEQNKNSSIWRHQGGKNNV